MFGRILLFIQELAHHAEDYMESRLQEHVRAELEERREDWDGDPDSEPRVDETDAHQQYAIDIPRLQRSALMILLMSELEKRMNLACLFVGSSVQAPKTVEKIKGEDRGLRRAMRYLQMCTSVSGCFSSDAWQAILLFAEIRNTIVHNQKLTATQRSELKEKRDQIDPSFFTLGLDIIGHGDLICLRPHYIDLMCEKISSFISLFEQELQELHPEILGPEFFLFSGGGGKQIDLPDL